MKRAALIILSCLVYSILPAQRLHLGIFGGLAAYSGDLTDKIFPKKVTNGAIGITGNYEVTDQIMLRAGITYAIVGGSDRFADTIKGTRFRNLSFETSILEFSAVGEYYLLNLYEKKYSPYFFAGLAVYHFDPYAYNGGTTKVYLQPLSTEGQDLNGYPDRKVYKLTQLAIPIGVGIKFAVSDNIHVGLEGGLRKLFTDYLDDVSTNYIDPADLLAAKGQIAVDMSYRSDEIGGSLVYPAKGAQRGSPKSKDYYYFTGIHLTYRLGSGGGGRGKSHMGCPANVY
jgi:Domain of unknown function (DUF6089)